MADLSNEAEEAVGRAKHAAGNLTGNDDLKAEGVADTAQANVEQGVHEVADKAADAIDAVADASSSALETASVKADDVEDAVGAAVDDSRQKLSNIADKTADTAHQFHLDDAASALGDKRVVIASVVASIVVALLVGRARNSSRGRKSTAKRAAAAGVGRALSR